MIPDPKYRTEVYDVLGVLDRGEGTWTIPDCELWLAFCEKEGLIQCSPDGDEVLLEVSPLGQLALKLRQADLDDPKLIETKSASPKPSEPAKLSEAEGSKPKAAKQAAVERLLGEESAKVLSIANSKKSADDKMREICGIDLQFLAYSSPEWAVLLGVTDAAIRKTTFWNEDRHKAIEADAHLRRE